MIPNADSQRAEKHVSIFAALYNFFSVTYKHVSSSLKFQARVEAEKDHDVALTGLQSKLRDLERKYELQAIKHEELTLEMDTLRKTAERPKPRAPMHTIEIQTESTDSGYMTNGHPPPANLSASPRLQAGTSPSKPRTLIPCQFPFRYYYYVGYYVCMAVCFLWWLLDELLLRNLLLLIVLHYKCMVIVFATFYQVLIQSLVVNTNQMVRYINDIYTWVSLSCMYINRTVFHYCVTLVN